MIKSKMYRTALLFGLCGAIAAGCSSNGTKENGQSNGSPSSSPEPTQAQLKQVELSWYYPVPAMQADQQKIEEEINKYIKEKINATVKLMPVPMGDYKQKLNTVTAASEAVDIIWTGYLFPVEENARKGSLLPVDGLIEKHAPNLKKDVPKVMWDGLTIDGKKYAIPNQQTNTFQWGVSVQKRFADKYNLDVKSIKKMEDLEPFLEQIKKNEPDIIPYGNFGSQYYPVNTTLWGLPGVDGYFFVKKGDPNYELLRYPEEALMNFKLASKWYKAGYIYKDAATAKEADFYSKGKVAVRGMNTLNPGVEADIKAANGGFDVIAIPLSDAFTNGYSATTNQSISRTSKNPERAMMFLDLVNSDKYLYNLLCYGILDQHYEKVSDNVVKVKAESKYAPNVNWVFGSVFNSYLKEGQAANVWEETKTRNATAELNPIGGFKFNSEPVNTEKANMSAVWAEYSKGMATGTMDFDATWPTVLERLKKAGEDKYAAEVKKQFEAYLKEKGLNKVPQK